MNRLHPFVAQAIREVKERHLKDLDLSWHLMVGDRVKLTSIPKEVFELTHLESLVFRGNSLTVVPDEISRLDNLKLLDLSYNNLATLPSAVGSLSGLKTL